MSVTISGSTTGLNVSSIIQSIIEEDSAPITALQTKDTSLSTESTNLGDLGTSLGDLSTSLQTLTPSLFNSMTTSVSNTSVGTASAYTASGTYSTPGAISVDIQQLSTSSVLQSGTLNAPPPGDTPITTVLNESNVAGETFSINGVQITLSNSDVLDDGNPDSTTSIVGMINNDVPGVTASYDSSTGQISLSSSSPIILGSPSDTSNFLQQAQLFTNGTGNVTSNVGLTLMNPTADLATVGLETTPTAGTFTVNGVSLTYTSGESLNDVISAINSSSAGVTAVYDTYENQLVLTSTQGGAQDITVSDGTSNLATALNLTSSDSQLQLGEPMLYTVGDSTDVREANGNTLNATDLNTTGVTFTATGTGSTTITVSPDVTTIASAINAFIAQYNTTQEAIAGDLYVDPTDSSVDGPLANNLGLSFLSSDITQATVTPTGDATINMLADLGIDTNANDSTLTQVNTSDLQDALNTNLSDVIALFNDPTSGLATSLQNVLMNYNGSLNGTIVTQQDSIATQIAQNEKQITQMQEQMDAEQTTLENQFAQLDTVQSKDQYLSSIFNNMDGSSSSSGSSSSTYSSGSSTPSYSSSSS